MAKKQFRNLKDLEKHLKNTIPQQIMKDGKVVSLLKSSMRQAVYDVVYDAYLPSSYQRRMDNGGLSDTNAMQITDAIMDGKNFKMIFENLTTGVDSLKGEYTTDTIEEGIRSNWLNPDSKDIYGRIVSEPRPFVATTMERIKSNPKPLIEAIKSSFVKCGFKVK